MARDLVNPRTRQATAFYAALAVSVYDAVRHGFHPFNMIMLGALAGLTVLGGLATVIGSAPPPGKP